jgi:EAL domain-containing protein (putative c-di-GMP-specific phosphodiesterase class I)
MYLIEQEHNNGIMRDKFSCDLDFVTHFVRNNEDELEAAYGPYQLTSSFQPIFSLAHQDVVGYEGLVRAWHRDGEEVPPLRLFRHGRHDFDEIFLDRLSRYLHGHNFSRQGNRRDWLFLNVSPKVIVSGKQYGDYFQSLLESADIDPRRVVIEIVEQGIEDEEKLAEAAEYYRNMGCLIAIDDFGKGHSNFNRIWQLKPEIVKLDRSLVYQARSSSNSRRVLKQLVSLIHESGSLVLIEGIETDYEALVAIDSGADLVQGYYFARPDKHLLNPEGKRIFKHLCDIYRLNTEFDYARNSENYRKYSHALKRCAQNLSHGEMLDKACASLLGMVDVKRCYLLDEDGWLRGQVVAHSKSEAQGSAKFVPLKREKGMVWSQWREFLKALEQNDEVHIGAQHLSLNDGRLSRTLSVNLDIQDRTYLLCCDVDIKDEEMVLTTDSGRAAVAAS